jgi:hypothetical protein
MPRERQREPKRDMTKKKENQRKITRRKEEEGLPGDQSQSLTKNLFFTLLRVL